MILGEHEYIRLWKSSSGFDAAGLDHMIKTRKEWESKELQLALMGRLLFASQQAKLIRVEARRRMSLQTGTAKEQRLATVDPRAEPKVSPE